MTLILPISLTAAAAAAFINVWLGWRVGQVRGSEGVSIGDGGNEKVIRRMRAHANFTEFTPFVLILIALLELATGSSLALWIVMAVYILSRVGHAFGMDGVMRLRMIGTIVTMTTLVFLAGYAIYVSQLTLPNTVTPLPEAQVETVPAG